MSLVTGKNTLSFASDTIYCFMKVKYLYVETDEDYISPQYKEKKGDIKWYKGYADNRQVVKLVYVYEGYVESWENSKKGRTEKCGIVWWTIHCIPQVKLH